ncbi:MAG: PrsW family intramembrane metalloprotease, partial [Candidatus Eisenbacteria bacterium]|nr:PrsW family intramembrane metalloprotease [Candidatus Eisenbacteria bacterium]
METLLGDDAQWSLICIAGPDVGKQIEFARGEDVILGSAPIDGVISEDPGVDAGHVVFRIRDGRPVFRVAPGHPEVELDGQQVARGRLRMGQMLRIGDSLWRLADEDSAQRAAKWLRAVGDRVASAAGVGSIEGFSFTRMFSEVVRRHPDEEVEDHLQFGSYNTTPSVSDIDTSWPQPWFFARTAALAVVVYVLFALAVGRWANPHLVPGMIGVGSFAVPLAVLMFFIGVNVARNISLYQIVKLFLIGGVVSLFVTLFLNDMTSWAFGFLPDQYMAMTAGPIEEVAKLLTLCYVVFRVRYRWIHNGLLFGAVVGCGFAAFESAGYAYRIGQDAYVTAFLQLLMQNGADQVMEAEHAARTFANEQMRENITLRGALTLAGGHIVWTALVGAALWKVRGQRRFRLSMMVR